MTQQKLYSLLAKKYNLSFIDARKICNSGFKFIRERVVSSDNKSILLAKLFKIKMKPKYERRITEIGSTKD